MAKPITEIKQNGCSCKYILQFVLALTAFVSILVSSTTSNWAVLVHKSTEEEMAHFGLWRSCAKLDNNKDGTFTCTNNRDGNFTVARFKNDSDVDNSAIYTGVHAKKMCLHPEFINKTVGNETKELLVIRVDCFMENLYLFSPLERSRVFSILAIVVSFIMVLVYASILLEKTSIGILLPVLSFLIPIWFLISFANFGWTYGGRFEMMTFRYGWSFILACVGEILSIGSTVYSIALVISLVSKETTSTYEMYEK